MIQGCELLWNGCINVSLCCGGTRNPTAIDHSAVPLLHQRLCLAVLFLNFGGLHFHHVHHFPLKIQGARHFEIEIILHWRRPALGPSGLLRKRIRSPKIISTLDQLGLDQKTL